MTKVKETLVAIEKVIESDCELPYFLIVRTQVHMQKIRHGEEDVVPELIRYLKVPNDQLRWSAAEALGRIGPCARVAIPALLEALEDEDRGVRASAAGALGLIGDREAVQAVLEALDDEDYWVRKRAAEALGRLGAREAVPALIEALVLLCQMNQD